ncbi:MAG: ABC transporter permease [Bacillaceae bacterium]|nr:ABC transporter permease [Bacillaceae bacterium]
MKSLTWLKYELKNMLTDYKVLCTIFVGPMIFLLFVSYLISPFLIEDRHFEKIDLALVNLDDSTITEMIIQHFLNDEGVEKYVNVLQVNEQEAEQLIKNNQVASTVIIPERFSADLSVGINTPVTVIGNQKQPLQAAMIKMLMESGANMVTASQAGINTVYSYIVKRHFIPADFAAILSQYSRTNSILHRKNVLNFLHIEGGVFFYDH